VFEEVGRLYAEGYTLRAIAQKLGKSRNAVRKYVQMNAFPEMKQRQRGPGQLAPFHTYLERRWREGCHNATQLWREIREQGFGGACSAVKQHLSTWRAKLPPEERRTSGRAPSRRKEARAPAPRTIVWWLLGAKAELTEEQAAFLERLKGGCPKVELAQSLTLEFFTTLEWSSGPVEGQVNRLKMVKRQMFGRAGLSVLRARILPTAKAA
jgi:transposase